jgi:phage-related protein
MSTVGPGVNEIRIHIEGEHRLFYVARLRHAIYVLHVFREKSLKTSNARACQNKAPGSTTDGGI